MVGQGSWSETAANIGHWFALLLVAEPRNAQRSMRKVLTQEEIDNLIRAARSGTGAPAPRISRLPSLPGTGA